MIIIAVDPGERRVGFAVCDAEEMIASPLKIETVRSTAEAIRIIEESVEETGAERIVIGYPRNMNGKPGPKAKESEEIMQKLREYGYDAVLFDERLTTAEAERSLKDANLSRKQRTSHLDAIAAQRILASYLASAR
ncbi:MAG: Holliday junction resolvase RuvX [Planctomycetes bacterium]|nr:Holliday junction resolvase RuvX [Planctomycetota bacterium]